MKASKISMGKFSYPIIVILFFIQVQKVYGFADIISLTVSSSGHSDETIVRLENQATYYFDSDWDAYKLSNSGSAPNFYTSLNGTNYSINSIPKDFTQFDIPLDLTVAFSGSYSIFIHSINNSYDTLLTVILEDKQAATSVVLKDSMSYNFDALTGDTSDRFVLHYILKSNTASQSLVSSVNSPLDQNDIDINVVDRGLVISINDSYSYASVAVVSTNGKSIYTKESNSYDKDIYIPLNSVSSGKIYLVKLAVDDKLYCRKIYY